MVVVIGALLSALATDAIGFKYMIGPMMLGLALPGGMPIGATMTERLDSFIALFLPVYMALLGYRTDPGELRLGGGGGGALLRHAVPLSAKN